MSRPATSLPSIRHRDRVLEQHAVRAAAPRRGDTKRCRLVVDGSQREIEPRPLRDLDRERHRLARPADQRFAVHLTEPLPAHTRGNAREVLASRNHPHRFDVERRAGRVGRPDYELSRARHVQRSRARERVGLLLRSGHDRRRHIAQRAANQSLDVRGEWAGWGQTRGQVGAGGHTHRDLEGVELILAVGLCGPRHPEDRRVRRRPARQLSVAKGQAFDAARSLEAARRGELGRRGHWRRAVEAPLDLRPFLRRGWRRAFDHFGFELVDEPDWKRARVGRAGVAGSCQQKRDRNRETENPHETLRREAAAPLRDVFRA
jgi:hypothetical protein